MASDKPLFAFFGTPHFAVFVLDALEAHGLLPALIVTAPDKPRGRGLEVSPSPVKTWAMARGIDTIEPSDLTNEELIADLRNTDWDAFVTAAYGTLIPQAVLDIPRRGSLNVHPSLLPKYRGASPVYSQILADDRTTGVTIMRMESKMDAGPIVAQARIEIALEDPDGKAEPSNGAGWPIKGSVLLELLATEGGNLLAEVLPSWVAGEIEPTPQDESQATYTKKFTNEDAKLDLGGDAHQNLLKIRAFDTKEFDSPARAFFIDQGGTRVIVTEAHIEDGTLKLDRVIPEGKKEMDFDAYRRG